MALNVLNVFSGLVSSVTDLPIRFMQAGPVADGTILSSPIVINVILPFLLVFTVIFALLQKSNILGEGRRQIDAIVSLVIALIVVSFGYATGIIVVLMPFLAVAVVIILVFLILYAMVFQGEEFKLHKGVKITLVVLIAAAVVIAVLVSTGAWDYIEYEFFYGSDSSAIVTNVIFLIIIAIAVIAVVVPGKRRTTPSESK
ncbi:MAG: hypothetical protein IIA87_00385 [Nanoarchaeota archaeon]|nr:hypothetical protein [Nanoarchaeota archaeon]